jgi:DNA invertase Pin-like site-specific DNA recombinase
LVIAKLDRLARNVHFISLLKESGVDFVACDKPHATRLTNHIMLAFAIATLLVPLLRNVAASPASTSH